MPEAVIVEAVRTPIARGKPVVGELSGVHAADLLAMSGIREYEQIQIYNITNGERFTTYAIQAEAGSRIISVNGAAAHKANVDDRVIICSYARMTEAEADAYKPSLVYLDESNNVTGTRNHIPVQKPRLISNH